MVSSAIVVTASKPRKQKQISAAPDRTPPTDVWSLKNGAKESIELESVWPVRISLATKMQKRRIKAIWKRTDKPLTRAADLIPTILTMARTTFITIIQTNTGIEGNLVFIKIPKVRIAI